MESVNRGLAGRVGTALVAGAAGAVIATAGIAVGDGALRVGGTGNTVQACVDANAGVRVYETAGCRPGETQLDLARPLAAGAAGALLAESSNSAVAADKVQDKIRKFRRKLDSLGDLSEEESFRLQIYMDRFAKLMELLSNVQKKASETQQAIIENFK